MQVNTLRLLRSIALFALCWVFVLVSFLRNQKKTDIYRWPKVVIKVQGFLYAQKNAQVMHIRLKSKVGCACRKILKCLRKTWSPLMDLSCQRRESIHFIESCHYCCLWKTSIYLLNSTPKIFITEEHEGCLRYCGYYGLTLNTLYWIRWGIICQSWN